MRLGINALYMVPGDVGGTETYLRETVVALLEEFPENEFVFFTNNENHELLQKICSGHGSAVFECLDFNAANRPLRIVLEQIKLPLIARRFNLDLLWSPGYTAPFLSFSPQAVTICDLQYKSYPEDMTWLQRVVLNFLVRGACRRCEIVLTISEFSREEVIKYGFARPEKVFPVLLGVDKSFADIHDLEITRESLNESLGVKQPYLLCVAHTYPHKKVDVLIDAYAQIMHSVPYDLVIVGRKRRGEDLVQEAVGKLGDKSRIIRFSQGVTYKELQILYQNADMFVLPSAYEGFGLPVIEAMMAGTPVITTHEASLKEVAGQSAFLVDTISPEAIAETIIHVTNLPALEKETTIQHAREWADTFTWKKSARAMFDVFQRYLDTK